MNEKETLVPGRCIDCRERVLNTSVNPKTNLLKKKNANENKNALDLNIDLIKVEHYSDISRFLDVTLSNILVQTIMRLTRVTHTTATLIDNIYVSYMHTMFPRLTSKVIMSDILDHFTITVQEQY